MAFLMSLKVNTEPCAKKQKKKEINFQNFSYIFQMEQRSTNTCF